MYASPWMDEDLVLFQNSVVKFINREFLPQAQRWEEQRVIDRAAWRKAGQAGLLCVSIPETYGGPGGTLAHEAVVAQEMYRAGLSGFAAGNGVSSALVGHYILSYGSEAQKQAWLPSMVTGERIGAIAMTEPGAGSDLQGIATRATPVEGGYSVNGQKTFISNGQNADLIVIVCRTDPAAGSKGISLLVLDASESVAGFRRGANLHKIGMHAQDTSELFFDDVFIPAANLLGVEGQGFVQLMQQLAWERLHIALGCVATMERAVELTIEYVKTRKAFGRPLMEFQNSQFKLAECKTTTTIARVLVDAFLCRLLAGELDPDMAAMAKLWVTEAQGRVMDECLQLHGGYGYVVETPIAQLYADSRITRIYGGTSEIMKLIIARSL